MNDSNKKHSFISLKWKAGLIFGLVLFTFNASFPVLVYWNSQQNFEFSRKQTQQQYRQELLGQLKTASQQLQSLAELSLVPEGASKRSIINTLNKYQNKLELDWNISQAQLFDVNSHKIGGWGDRIPSTVNALIPKVLNKEIATTLIDCKQGCKQFDLLPVLAKGKTQYVLLLAYDLSSALLDFSTNTGADVAVLSKSKPYNQQNNHYLPQWDMTVNVLTSFEENINYLKTFTQNHSVTELKRENKLIHDHNLPVEFNLVTIESNNDLVFLIIDNIATQRQDIFNITIRSIVIALFSTLILGGGLFLFLSRPLSRLSSVSQALPLLAKQRYDNVREMITPQNNSNRNDELDQLEISTYALTSQLEDLHISIKERSEALHSRSMELRQERDFIKSLIDTAQLIIVTIDRQCQITSFNDFGEHITGHLEIELLNTPFKRLFPHDQWPEVEASLLHLKKHPGAVSQQESEFINSDGSLHIISWLHSSLAHPTDSSVVLAVGLDITKKKQDENKIIWLADHDVLTELYNRRKFNIEFENILKQSKRFNHEGVLLFLDLDQFKDINDSCGHEAGDQVLKQVAQSLQSLSRTTDIIARLGGDEFAILLPETDIQGGVTLSEKIASQLEQLNITFDNTRYKITTSIGIVNFPLSGLSVEELISNADLAMYEAKARGKNTWYQYSLDGKTRQQLETRVLWKDRIEDALENNRFVFYYQPIMDIRTRTVSHYEALIRMTSEDGTVHPPATFIQVAEQTGLIHHIDHLVLKQGIYKQAELDASQSETSLSLNLSGYAVADTLLQPMLEHLLKDSNVNPHNLIFELTETAAVADIKQAKELMDQLKKLGCRFSLDDFGTGFASFRYMRELPVDIVKIDGSFVTNLADSPDDQLFVKALVDVAKGMGKKTIAEFVENAETLALLHAFGVDYAQGYYIGKPEPEFLDGPPVLK